MADDEQTAERARAARAQRDALTTAKANIDEALASVERARNEGLGFGAMWSGADDVKQALHQVRDEIQAQQRVAREAEGE